tara:strand:- start:319 stop:537 length:219 start_codon:yes stop_codon:yes gene_type:complete
MGRMKNIFLEDRQCHLLNDVDCFVDEDYHYKQWLKSQESYYMWVPERDGRTLEDMERETKEELKKNNNLNKG